MALADPRERIAARLGKQLRVTLTDGRVLIGVFTCLDKQRNVLLTEAREQKAGGGADDGDAAKGERYVGLVLVPRRWIAACHTKLP